MVDILVTGQEAYFNEDAKFFKDVYVYGNVYALGEGGLTGAAGAGNFTGSVTIPENLFVGGISTFVGRSNFLSSVNIEDLQVGILTVTKKFDVGVGGTVLTASVTTGNIGIGITIPRQKLDITGITLISEKLGIGNISPQQALDVTGIALVSNKLGIGNASPQQALDVTGIALVSNKLGINSTSPEQSLDVIGNVKFSSQLYDSTNSPGVTGAFLTKDAQGIKWTPFEPSFVEGIFVYNEEILVGVNSFRGLNLKTGINTSGISTDNVQGYINPSNPSIADIFVYDYWGTNSSGDIYRNTNVGIGTSIPRFNLDVLGSVGISSFLIVGGATSLSSTLDVTGITTLRNQLIVGGATSLSSTLDVTGITTLRNQLIVGGATSLSSTLDVTGITTLRNQLTVKGPSILEKTLDVTGITTLRDQLIVGGATSLSSTLDVTGITTLRNQLTVKGPSILEKTLDVTGITTLRNQLIVGGATSLSSTLDVTGITTLRNQLIVGGATSLSSTLDVTGITTLRNQLTVKGPSILEKTLDVTGITTLRDQLIVGGATSLSSTLDVTGITTLRNQLIVGGATSLSSTLDVTGITTLRNQLTVKGPSILEKTLDVTGITTLRNQLIVGGATSLSSTLDVTGITTLRNQLIVGGATSLSSTLDVTGITTLRDQLIVGGATSLSSTLDVTDITTLRDQLIVGGATSLSSTLDVTDITTLRDQLIVGGATSLSSTLDVTGITTLRNQLIVGGATSLSSTLDVTGITTLRNQLIVGGATSLSSTLLVGSATTLQTTLQVGIAGTVITTTGIGSVGIGTNLPSKGLDIANQVLIQKAVYDSNRNVGYKTEFYKTPRTVLGQVGVNTAGEVISDRFFDAANLIRLNLDFIAAEAVGFITSTDYLSGAFVVSGVSSYRDDIKRILKSITLDITKGGNSQSVGAGLSYYNGGSFVPITPGSQQTATVVAITTAAQISQSVINNVLDAGKTVGGLINVTNAVYDNTTGIIIITAAAHNLTVNGVVKLVGLGFTCPSGPGTVIYPSGNFGYKFNVKSVVGINVFSVNVGISTLPHTYVSGGTIQKHTNYQNQFTQIRDLTIQNDASVGSNENFSGCSNVVSAIYTCAGIVTAIIGGGSGSAPTITQPDGKVVWVPPGTDVRNLVWVNKYGNDDNGGKTEGDAKLTIAAAAAVAEPGDTIMVRSGVYYENNPIGLRTDVSVTGQDLRLVTVVPQNSGKDVFHVRRGCLIENMNFACETGESNPGGGALAFPPIAADIVSGKSYGAVTGYTAPGPANEGPSGRWRSPYVRNCTNFMKESIGMKIDGNHATASTIGADLKSMVCDSFTQYNEAGIGVSITNNGYAQLVSIFTINCDIAIYCDTGGQCDLTNSNSSFGNFGLKAVGLGRTEFTGIVSTTTTAEADKIVFANVTDGNQVRRPYDGQALWFKIDLSNYGTGQTGIITAPLQQLNKINVINNISGYSPSAPPDVTIYDYNTNIENPLGPEGIIAELSPTISDAGEIINIDVVGSGRNYLSSQDMRVKINGIPTNDLTAVMEPIYFTVSEATSPTVSGITTVTLNEFVPYLVYANDNIEIRRISRILTSGHSFEYIGTGTDINTSTPLKGAVPIKENEIVALDGAQIPYTSTDQKGNFNIGEGIQVDQTTATIRGRDFSKAIQAQVTPLILALR